VMRGTANSVKRFFFYRYFSFHFLFPKLFQYFIADDEYNGDPKTIIVMMIPSPNKSLSIILLSFKDKFLKQCR
jgi:hypothetical protein